jgi:hypothetical protein
LVLVAQVWLAAVVTQMEIMALIQLFLAQPQLVEEVVAQKTLEETVFLVALEVEQVTKVVALVLVALELQGKEMLVVTV